jgi:hypothetical protein
MTMQINYPERLPGNYPENYPERALQVIPVIKKIFFGI